jgi:hypothetical protein
MIPFFPVLYMAFEFLLDQKELVAKFMKAAKKRRNKELKKLSAYNYELGLQALRRWESQIPSCVKLYYLGKAQKPTTEQIISELQKMNHSDNGFIEKVVKGTVIAAITILTLIALFI